MESLRLFGQQKGQQVVDMGTVTGRKLREMGGVRGFVSMVVVVMGVEVSVAEDNLDVVDSADAVVGPQATVFVPSLNGASSTSRMRNVRTRC